MFGIGGMMPVRRVAWYSIDDDDYRFELVTVHRRDWSECAVEAAEDYHFNHDGWESSWPLNITLYESEDGPAVAKYEVERETVPEFHAIERPLSVAPAPTPETREP